MLLAVAGLLLLASGAPGTAAPPAPRPAAVVILRDGTRYDLSKPCEIRGTQARLSLTTGFFVAVRASEIDEEASRRATDAANAPRPPAPTPTVPSLATAAAASADAPKKAAKTLTIEGNPDDARPVTGGSSYAPPRGTAPKTVYTGPRGGKYTVGDTGHRNYVPKTGPPAPK